MADRRTIRVPIPIENTDSAFIVPTDLTPAEAERIAEMVRAFALEADRG